MGRQGLSGWEKVLESVSQHLSASVLDFASPRVGPQPFPGTAHSLLWGHSATCLPPGPTVLPPSVPSSVPRSSFSLLLPRSCCGLVLGIVASQSTQQHLPAHGNSCNEHLLDAWTQRLPLRSLRPERVVQGHVSAPLLVPGCGPALLPEGACSWSRGWLQDLPLSATSLPPEGCLESFSVRLPSGHLQTPS